MNDQKVLIIGAGPAGSCLAQILRKNGIPFEIFEREDDLNARRGGGFGLDDALEVIDELLPDDMGDYNVGSANYAVGVRDEFAFVDGVTGQITYKSHGDLESKRPTMALMRRKYFRDWMIQHLDVQKSKRLARYEEDNEGVTAFFTDGTQARGSLLVGADGANSAVRKGLLENNKLELHDFVPICGDVALTGKALEQIRDVANAGVVALSPNAHMVLAQLDIDPDASEARFWYMVAFRSADPAADTAWVQAASKESLHKKATEAVRNMPEILSDAIRRAGPWSLWNSQIRLAEYVPPSKLPRGRVTLLGDAAHTTTPFGGMGANVSIRDACDLGKMLSTEDWASSGDLQALLYRYEQIMLPRGRELVLQSRSHGFYENSDKRLYTERRAPLIPVVPPMWLSMPSTVHSSAPSEVGLVH